MSQSLFIRRRRKVLLPLAEGKEQLPLRYVVTAMKNLEAVGYTFSEKLVEACRWLSLDQLVELYQDLIAVAKRSMGAHQTHRPMYPNFPQQVMEMSKFELYFNAIVHYISGGFLVPATEKKERFPLIDNFDLRVLDLGTQAEFDALFTQIASANTSPSVQDKDDLLWFVASYADAIKPLIPSAIPQKETAATLAMLLMDGVTDPETEIAKFIKTTTDVMRLAVALSGGDVSLAEATKYRRFKRHERRLLLSLIDRSAAPTEDMLRRPQRWKRLGHELRSGDYKTRYPRAFAAFDVIQNDKPLEWLNSNVEQALAGRQIKKAVTFLNKRPGDFARRLDHLIRLASLTERGDLTRRPNIEEMKEVVQEFAIVAEQAATPLLLQVMHHFKVRNAPRKMRTFFPKGNEAKAKWIPNKLASIPQEICHLASLTCETALIHRFSQLPPMGTVFVDKNLESYLVPFAGRSASKSLRSIVRGSRIPLPKGCDVLRMFIFWKGHDIDLSAVSVDKDFNVVDTISYYNLKSDEGCHSGDLTYAPEGGSEFIDFNLSWAKRTSRYVGMVVQVFSGPNFSDHEECFAGWMARSHVQSGEIYDPRTVIDRVDLTAKTQIALPLLVDLQERKVIWCDMGLKRNPHYGRTSLGGNNVENNSAGISGTMEAVASLDRANLFELFTLHARARGTLVNSPVHADTVLSVVDELPFKGELIAAEYMQ